MLHPETKSSSVSIASLLWIWWSKKFRAGFLCYRRTRGVFMDSSIAIAIPHKCDRILNKAFLINQLSMPVQAEASYKRIRYSERIFHIHPFSQATSPSQSNPKNGTHNNVRTGRCGSVPMVESFSHKSILSGANASNSRCP